MCIFRLSLFGFRMGIGNEVGFLFLPWVQFTMIGIGITSDACWLIQVEIALILKEVLHYFL